MPKQPSIYCDTSTLFHNVRGQNVTREIQALEILLEAHRTGKCIMRRSRVALRDLDVTKDLAQRGNLKADYNALGEVANDEVVKGLANFSDRLGTFITVPMVSDVQDDNRCAMLVKRGLDLRDAQHITQAICNGCHVFLTRDEKTINKSAPPMA